MPPRRRAICTIGAATVLFIFMAAATELRGASWQTATNPDAQILDAFRKRVHAYVVLHQKFEGSIAKLPDRSTPQQIDTFQRELGKELMAARSTARQGDVFGAAAPIIRRLLAPVFAGANGKRVRAEISDEPHPALPRVNVRYPDDVPLSTMPPDVLRALPKLEEDLEYRFIGRHLILLDPHAHLIVDVIDNVIPQ
jgi:hypothetical protein